MGPPVRSGACVVALGNFDGVHLGHRALVERACALGADLDLPTRVVTFWPHPKVYFSKNPLFFHLTSPPVKERILKDLGVFEIVTLGFNDALASLSPLDFLTRILKEQMGALAVVVGEDFCFGKGRLGTVQTLLEAGPSLGFSVTVIPPVEGPFGPLSSTQIRGFLTEGRVRDARGCLGRPWTILAPVVAGDGRGRGLGFPTTNHILEEGCMAREGIYAALVSGRGLDRRFAAAYIGRRPTFQTQTRYLECHLLDISGDFYGEEFWIEMIDFVRPDGVFSSPEALCAQMEQDCRYCLEVLEDFVRDAR